ncbi:class I SAM-dependent methyltransferase [Sphingosinicella sp. CPCC 101087]|uniref:class I SAM-dependent methyltransferase n=1 Tax=Sphingosinicella sp. CPCC 101087 TaxID=2497754 RepID=UPI0013EA1CB9|nr:methyltransferase domain-containing protein [Sphingosinicella sp. CPCC 101087]
MPYSDDQRQIERNVRIHDRVAADYEKMHDEIFNPVEQDRLRRALARAKEALRTGAERPRALDFGCGSGNLTRHLLALGFEVVAADISPAFLALIERRHAGQPVETHLMDGRSLASLADSAFDFAATYSVMHHVPDYLGAATEMGRIVRPGGIVYIDHEHSPSYWGADPAYRDFLRRASRFDWRKFLVPHNYYGKFRRMFVDPHYSNEGDIHVWPDDHIEWDEIEGVLRGEGFDTLFAEDYLVFRGRYRPEVYEEYRTRCTDMRVLAMRKAG